MERYSHFHTGESADKDRDASATAELQRLAAIRDAIESPMPRHFEHRASHANLSMELQIAKSLGESHQWAVEEAGRSAEEAHEVPSPESPAAAPGPLLLTRESSCPSVGEP